MAATPTSRTLEVLKSWGYHADKVERYMISWKAAPENWLPYILERFEGAKIDKAVMDQIVARAIQAQKKAFGTRKDWGGFGDILSVGDGGITLIQCCASSGIAEHIKKISGEDCWEHLNAWLDAGGCVEMWGWRKIKPPEGSRRSWWGRVLLIFKDDDGNVCSKDVGDYSIDSTTRPGKAAG